MRIVLDSGALLALEKADRPMWRRLKSAAAAGLEPVTHGGVIGQAWRGSGPRQALLSRALAGIEVRALGDQLGRAAGELLANSKTTDVIDAGLVLLAEQADLICTSDIGDIRLLAEAAGQDVELIEV